MFSFNSRNTESDPKFQQETGYSRHETNRKLGTKANKSTGSSDLQRMTLNTKLETDLKKKMTVCKQLFGSSISLQTKQIKQKHKLT